MYDWHDTIISISLLIIAIGILLLCTAGTYGIIKQAKNPKDFKTYEINGNLPALTIIK